VRVPSGSPGEIKMAKDTVFTGRHAVMCDPDLSAGARLLFDHLCRFTFGKDWTNVSQATLAAVGCGDDKTIDSRTRELERAGYIAVKRRRGCPNLYTLLLSDDDLEVSLDALKERQKHRKSRGPITPRYSAVHPRT
jgi:hypothetical protein